MKKCLLISLLVIRVFCFSNEPSLVASISMEPLLYSNDIPIIKDHILYYKNDAQGEDIAYPFLFIESNKIGIYDYLTSRIFWITENGELMSVSPFSGRNKPIIDGIYWNVEGNCVQLYKENKYPWKQIVVKIANQKRPFFGGVWYESDTLFFFDENDNIFVIENPMYSDEDNYLPNINNIKNELYVKDLLQKNPDKYSISWSDKYRIIRNGYPIAKVYNKDWRLFFDDKKKTVATNLLNNEIPALWNNRMTFLAISDNKTFWGGNAGIYIVVNGIIDKKITWPDTMWQPLISDNGYIYLQSEDTKHKLFKVYRIAE